MSKEITILSTRDKVTKGTVRFAEHKVLVDGEEALLEVAPMLYVRKSALDRVFGTTDVQGVILTIARADTSEDES